jgi:hypothetical protein
MLTPVVHRRSLKPATVEVRWLSAETFLRADERGRSIPDDDNLFHFGVNYETASVHAVAALQAYENSVLGNIDPDTPTQTIVMSAASAIGAHNGVKQTAEWPMSVPSLLQTRDDNSLWVASLQVPKRVLKSSKMFLNGAVALAPHRASSSIKCLQPPAPQARSQRFETIPSRSVLQATRNRLANFALLILGDEDAFYRAREQPREVGLATRERQPSVVLAVTGEHVESIGVRPLFVLARTQRVEVRGAVAVEHDQLAVDHEMLLAQLHAAATISGKRRVQSWPPLQAHAVLLTPVAVVLDLVQPVGACGHLVRFDGEPVTK